MTDREMQDILKEINKQQGRPYPLGNQIVVCGFFSTEEDWNKFLYNNKNKIIEQRKDKIIFNNGERWYHFKNLDFSRGYRFYKVKVSHTIDSNLFFNVIFIKCIPYCKEIEWL